MSWLLFSVYCIGQIWPHIIWQILPYGLHTRIPIWIRAKTPIPYALESWGLPKWRLGFASTLSTRVTFASATLVDLFLPNPVIQIFSATAASAWPCCQIHDWQADGNHTWNTLGRSGSGAGHWPPLASAALCGAGESNSSVKWFISHSVSPSCL